MSAFKHNPINPTELRIGNLIYDDLGHVVHVSSLTHQTVESVIDENDRRVWTTVFRPLPIPIRDDVLERFGFEYEYTIGGFLRWQKGEFKLLDRRLPHPQFHHPQAMIQFVHELQNLYFALTHEELTL